MAIIAPYLPAERLRVIADEFLAQHHPSGEIPVPIEHIIEFAFGLDIVPMPGLKENFDVDGFIASDMTEIRVDSFVQKKYPNRYRFSLAHELAHFIVHKDTFASLRFSTISEWKTVMAEIPADQYSYIEFQAYCLAGLILVPPLPLAALFAAKSIEAKRAGIIVQDLGDNGRKIIASNIGKYFEVSSEVIIKRLSAEKLW